ncbi:2TM domain-containing protein [Aquimarina sp. RZ0]|uniref:2TM domain-containing protein n=1 Tax=Aquimarina sp. RZ0 TaxID=2607730 RepID=UPI0011F35AAD|nr:2TM domain-containing protein [Aquimarina sp. RZ0]KAA1245017.1 2TM domain-containing protein [Aquimarina sp. RZ0]
MFSKRKETTQIDAQQRELFEHARKRIIQKKRLFQHFILFVVGSVFMIILNLVLGFGKDSLFLGLDWFVIAILIWAFLFVLHFCNVWLFSKFMGKEWTDRQMERLIAKQQKEIANIQKEVELMNPKEGLVNKKNKIVSPQSENQNQETQ